MKLVFHLDPEAIHIMVPGETEEEFDKRIESYEEVDMRNTNKFLLSASCTGWLYLLLYQLYY